MIDKIKKQIMWAWWNNKTKSFSHIYNREMLVRMCSPDGFKDKENNREGKIVKVVVKEYQAIAKTER